jgi:hypothetical protein
MIECLREVGKGRGDNLFCFADPESVPLLSLADEMRGADTPVVEAAVDGEREVVVDLVFLEEVRDAVVDVGEHAAAGKVQDGEVLGMGVVVAEERGEREPAQEIGDRPALSLKRAEELGDPVCARAAGVTRRIRVLELRVLIDPVEAERLGRVFLVNQRDRLAVDSPVVALDDEVLTGTVADEFCAVIREPEFGGERVPVVLPREPVSASRQPRLEDVGGVRAAPRQIPLITEPGEQQLGW